MLGPNWHRSGRLEFKKNSFIDFKASLSYLEDKGWSRAVVVHGRGAGALIALHIALHYTDLISCLWLEHPFVEVLDTLLSVNDTTTCIESKEFGSVYEQPFFQYILSYDPYFSIKNTSSFPPVWINAGKMDARVPFWRALRLIARLRQYGTKENKMFLNVDKSGYVACTTCSEQELSDLSFQYAFVLDQIIEINLPIKNWVVIGIVIAVVFLAFLTTLGLVWKWNRAAKQYEEV